MDNAAGLLDISQLALTHNQDESRFEAAIGEERALVEYELRDGVYAITETFTPPAFRGYGVAAKLTQFALDTIRAEGGRVLPVCPYAITYIERHPQVQDLLAGE